MTEGLTLEKLYSARTVLDVALFAVDRAITQIGATHVDDKLEDLLAELKQCKVLLHETRSYAREEYNEKRNEESQA